MPTLPPARRSLLAAPLLALLAATSAAAQEEPTAGAVAGAADRAVAWLRTQQDAETGAYGRGAGDTAWVLSALARSPRAYRVDDGPFVRRAVEHLLSLQREDGAFAPEGSPEKAAVLATNLALDALEDLELAGPTKRVTAALGFLGEARERKIGTLDALADRELDAVRARAAQLLAAQAEDGSWGGEGDGAVRATAARLLQLSAAHEVLSQSQPAAAPRDAEPLPTPQPVGEKARERTLTAMERGALYLLGVAEEGLWGAPGTPDAGITAMVLGALQTIPEPRPEKLQAAIDRGLAWLLELQREDGSIHQGQLASYVTSASILALARAGREEHAPAIARAREFLVRLQADEGEGYTTGDRYYGGVGYGSDQRPDLSNLQLAMEALSAAGLDPGDEAFVKAVKFLERTQNRSESNDVVVEADGAVIRSGNDGGAAYAPGDSKAGFAVLADGTKVPRSYGSMTYALLKGYLFAGLDREDPRVEAAWKWCLANYTLDVNPGFEASSDPTAAYQGLFYYFYTMARALDLYGQEVVVDSAGVEHSWRPELIGRVLAMQRQDGSWVNTNSPRWYEGNPVLATSYALLVLETALPE